MCGVEICPVHTRTDSVEPVLSGVPARAITYHGEYCVATLDNPGFTDPLIVVGRLLGEEVPDPGMFMHLVVKVGDGCLGDLLDDGTSALTRATVFREEFLFPGDPRVGAVVGTAPNDTDLDAFNAKLTEIMHDAHNMVLSSVKEGIIA